MASKEISVFLLKNELHKHTMTNANLLVNAARDLRNYPDQESVDVLINALRESDIDEVRSEAACSLGELKSSDAVDALIGAFQGTSSHEVAKSAAIALNKIGGDKASKAMIAALEDKKKRPAALLALGGTSDPEALQPLLKIFRSEGTPTIDRKRAADIIGSHAGQIDPGIFMSALNRADRLYFVESILRILNKFTGMDEFARAAQKATARAYRDLLGSLKKLRKGMKEDEILDRFGEPDSVTDMADLFVKKQSYSYETKSGEFQAVVRNGVVTEWSDTDQVIQKLEESIKGGML